MADENAQRMKKTFPSKRLVKKAVPTGPGLALTFGPSTVNADRICFVPIPEWIGMYTCDSQQKFSVADSKVIGEGRRAFWYKKEVLEKVGKRCRTYAEKQ